MNDPHHVVVLDFTLRVLHYVRVLSLPLFSLYVFAPCNWQFVDREQRGVLDLPTSVSYSPGGRGNRLLSQIECSLGTPGAPIRFEF